MSKAFLATLVVTAIGTFFVTTDPAGRFLISETLGMWDWTIYFAPFIVALLYSVFRIASWTINGERQKKSLITYYLHDLAQVDGINFQHGACDKANLEVDRQGATEAVPPSSTKTNLTDKAIAKIIKPPVDYDLISPSTLARLVSHWKSNPSQVTLEIAGLVDAAIEVSPLKHYVAYLLAVLKKKGIDCFATLAGQTQEAVNSWNTDDQIDAQKLASVTTGLLSALDSRNCGLGLIDVATTQWLSTIPDDILIESITHEMGKRLGACLLVLLPPSRTNVLLNQLDRGSSDKLLKILSTESTSYTVETAESVLAFLKARYNAQKIPKLATQLQNFHKQLNEHLPYSQKILHLDSITKDEFGEKILSEIDRQHAKTATLTTSNVGTKKQKHFKRAGVDTIHTSRNIEEGPKDLKS